MAAPGRTPRPWVPGAEPSEEQVAQFLRVCTDQERIEFYHAYSRSSAEAERCFAADHAGWIAHLQRNAEVAHDDIAAILRALGLGDHARPVSTHEVVQQEILPAIERLTHPAVVVPGT